MEFKKLSVLVQEFPDPQRTDVFVRSFRMAVRDGVFDAANIEGRFVIPKVTHRRNGNNEQKNGQEMVFEVTPAFELWYEQITKDLTRPVRPKKVKPTLEAFQAGQLDFKTLAEVTRQKLRASESKGRQLGESRWRDLRAKSGT